MEVLDYSQPLEANKNNVRSVQIVEVNEDVNIVYADLTFTTGEVHRQRFNFKTGVAVGHMRSDEPLRLRNCGAEKTESFFYVSFSHKDWEKTSWKPADFDRYSYDNGKLAAKQATKMNSEARENTSPWKFRVSKELRNASATDWRGWMKRRFNTGEYVQPVWKDEDWFKASKLEHFAHPSLKNGAMIAYVSSEENGLADKMTVISPGRYLTQHFSDVLSEEEIAQWATKFDVDSELIIATDGEEIANVYQNSGIASCMSYNMTRFHDDMKQHPTSVYGAGDLALAYLRRRGRTISRAVVWPEKKVWLRLYGDVRRLQASLEGAGYRAGRTIDFEGARLLRVKSPRGRDRVLMPYLDLNLQAKPDEDEKFLRVTRIGPIAGCNHSTGDSGMDEAGSTRMCGVCHDVEVTYETGAYFPRFQRLVCEDCCNRRNAWQCTFSGDWFEPTHHGMEPVPVLDPKTGEITGTIAKGYIKYHDEVVVVGRQYYLREGLSWDDSNKQWVVPSVAQPRKAA